MLFFGFSQTNHFVFTLCSMFFLLFATIYSSKLKQRTGLYYFLFGFILLFITSVLQQNADYFYSHAVSAKMYVLVEVICILISSICIINAASHVLLDKPIDINILFAFISGSLLLIIYAIFISNNAHITDNIRQILPVIGMLCMFLSFIATSRIWRKFGNILAATSILGFIALMIYPLVFNRLYYWYLPNIFMLTLGLSYIFMLIESTNKKLQQLLLLQEKNSVNIKNIIKSSPFPIVLSRLGDDTLLMANNNALKLFRLEEREINRYHFKDFFVDAENRKLLTERLEFNKEVHNFEILVKTAAGNTPFWLLLSANIVEYNNDVVLYSAFQDITLRKRQESMLQSQADRDPLTSIYNRRFFENNVVGKIKQAHEKKIPFAIFMIDADKFKNINDKYGHKIGDKVLIELANVCERSLRPDDLIARYGGEEFVAFINNVDEQTSIMVANRLRKAISESVIYSDEQTPVMFSVSIGVAPSGISDNVSVMIKMADDAMYLAKQNGRNRVELYDKDKMEQMLVKSEVSNKSHIHPAFYNEETQEISLLDGVESATIIED